MNELSTSALTDIYDSPDLASALTTFCACGAPVVLSPGLDALICSHAITSRGCPFKVAARLYAVIQHYNLTDFISLEDFEHLCQEREYSSCIDFFVDDWEDDTDLDVDGYVDICDRLKDAIKSDSSIATYARLSGFDVLSEDMLYMLCGGIETVNDFIDLLDTSGISFLTSCLGLTEAHLIPAAIHIYNRLSECLAAMSEIEEWIV